MLKQAIYFYKDDGENIVLFVGDYNDVKTVFFQSNEQLERINRDFPQTKNNLYVLIDGVTFKLKA